MSLARKKYDVKYPALYAESKHEHHKEFNCVQRAHQQTLEWLAPVQALTLANGIAFPIASAALCGAWTVGKFIYIQGYGSGNPDKRHLGGAIAHLADLPLIIMTFFAANKLLSSA